MTRKAVLISISKNIVWKETSKYLKHYRMKYLENIEEYNKIASTLIDLYRKTEFEIETEWKRYSKFQFRELIKNIEKGK